MWPLCPGPASKAAGSGFPGGSVGNAPTPPPKCHFNAQATQQQYKQAQSRSITMWGVRGISGVSWGNDSLAPEYYEHGHPYKSARGGFQPAG